MTDLVRVPPSQRHRSSRFFVAPPQMAVSWFLNECGLFGVVTWWAEIDYESETPPLDLRLVITAAGCGLCNIRPEQVRLQLPDSASKHRHVQGRFPPCLQGGSSPWRKEVPVWGGGSAGSALRDVRFLAEQQSEPEQIQWHGGKRSVVLLFQREPGSIRKSRRLAVRA